MPDEVEVKIVNADGDPYVVKVVNKESDPHNVKILTKEDKPLYIEEITKKDWLYRYEKLILPTLSFMVLVIIGTIVNSLA
ncbi:hypothetical protein [Candidatus Magnetobacterium casense]|uniref:Uncharacterized protein n=1 Tax=Candidatus Magnetobacterium casense TaxID=1455061 RepID=A0ABS6S226_9BACT|nr:hypothetical protein [Candidatus Magnetobacterium casensis]MBV6342902.1 hypothetical protein [Candidatus Magnetobacterium casensis]